MAARVRAVHGRWQKQGWLHARTHKSAAPQFSSLCTKARGNERRKKERRIACSALGTGEEGTHHSKGVRVGRRVPSSLASGGRGSGLGGQRAEGNGLSCLAVNRENVVRGQVYDMILLAPVS